MSQQNVKNWTDKFGTIMEIGQTVAACRGKELHVGEILWFTPKGVTIDALDKNGNVKKISIPYEQSYSVYLGPNKFFVVK